jgi:hypothetical protein
VKHRDKLQTANFFDEFNPPESNVDGYKPEEILLTTGMVLEDIQLSSVLITLILHNFQLHDSLHPLLCPYG